MLMKRHYRAPEGWRPNRNVPVDRLGEELKMSVQEALRAGATFRLKDPSRPENDLLNPPPVDHVEIHHTGIEPEQNFSRRLVEAAVAEGWMTLSRGKLILHAQPEDLTYTILRGPGHYCCHCAEKIASDANGAQAREHVAAKHADATAPDPQWPTGYRVVNAYECVLDEAQHAKFKAQPIGKRR